MQDGMSSVRAKRTAKRTHLLMSGGRFVISHFGRDKRHSLSSSRAPEVADGPILDQRKRNPKGATKSILENKVKKGFRSANKTKS